MTANDATTDGDYRLPYGVAPRRYELRLAPDLERATFAGAATVEIEVLEATDRVVMNAAELEIADAALRAGWGEEPGEARPLRVELDEAGERVGFIPPGPIAPGRYRLSCTFSGVLNDKLRGFYRSRYLDEGGNERVIATTQFEETSARMAFPCFDEPDRKAVFAVVLDAPAGMLAISNGPQISREVLADGTVRHRFGETIPMSTYLVAFVVGPLEATEPEDVGGVALRVVHVPGKAKLTGPALDVARHALGFFSEYFALPYPGEKLDLVALPDFAAGAMENLGCVTFREAILLADPDATAQPEMERLAEVVEHELAHMWFGDLVTMRWWNGIWLNEAFATFMSLLCQDDYRPEWQCFVSFARGKSQALAVDGLHATRPIEFPVARPEEAAAMFDILTYEKGASVLWMVEQYLGRERFRDGVRRYLAAHRLSNTETSDLWDAIEAEAGDVPIRALMDSWIFQGGYPLVSASAAIDGSGAEVVELRQQPFAYLPEPPDPSGASAIGSEWIVPVIAAPVTGRAEARVLLGTQPVQLRADGGPVVVNAGGAGFYRLRYDTALRFGLLGELESLESLERYNLVADTWATVVAGLEPLAEFFEVVARLERERDPHVWSVVIGALRTLDLVTPEEDRALLARYARELLAPQLVRVGWERAAGEDEQTPVLRASLVAALGTIGEDAAVVERARELFAADQAGTRRVDADLASAVLSVVAAHAGREEFDGILGRYRQPLSPLDEQRHLNALASLRDLALAREVHELCLGEIRSQNAPYLLNPMLASRTIGPATWEFVSSHYDELVARFPDNSIHRMLEGIVGLVAFDDAGRSRYLGPVRAFLTEHVHGGHRRLVEQSLERLETNTRFALAARPVLRGLLAPG